MKVNIDIKSRYTRVFKARNTCVPSVTNTAN